MTAEYGAADPAREDRHARLRRPDRDQQVRQARVPRRPAATCASRYKRNRICCSRRRTSPCPCTVRSRPSSTDPGTRRSCTASGDGHALGEGERGARLELRRGIAGGRGPKDYDACRRIACATWPRSSRAASATRPSNERAGRPSCGACLPAASGAIESLRGEAGKRPCLGTAIAAQRRVTPPRDLGAAARALRAELEADLHLRAVARTCFESLARDAVAQYRAEVVPASRCATRSIEQPLTSASPCPGPAGPARSACRRYQDWGDLLHLAAARERAGPVPLHGSGVFPLKQPGRGPRADVRGRGRTRAHEQAASTTCRLGMPAKRACRPPSTRSRSTARTRITRPDIYGKVGNSGVSDLPRSTTPRSSTRAST